jgi:hypothetical protein
MSKTKVIFKLIIIFSLFILISGCSKKYLDSREEEFLGQEILSTWKDLDVEIVGQDYEKLSLNIQAKDFIEIKDSLSVKEIYKYGFEQEDGSVRGNSNFSISLGLLTGCSGCMIGGCEWFEEVAMDMKDGFEASGAIGTIFCWYSSLFFTLDGLRQKREFTKTNPAYIQVDTVCVDSFSVSEEEIKIMVNNTGFESIYFTNNKGDINLKFGEIIPKLIETDSILNIIIYYKEMVDSVEVDVTKMED